MTGKREGELQLCISATVIYSVCSLASLCKGNGVSVDQTRLLFLEFFYHLPLLVTVDLFYDRRSRFLECIVDYPLTWTLNHCFSFSFSSSCPVF